MTRTNPIGAVRRKRFTCLRCKKVSHYSRTKKGSNRLVLGMGTSVECNKEVETDLEGSRQHDEELEDQDELEQNDQKEHNNTEK